VNAFQRVMSNIHRLQDADIAVRIRLNIDMHNADYLMELAEELHREFQETKGINVYAHALFEEVKGSKAMLDDQNRTFIYERMKELRALLDSYQMVKPVKLDRKVTTNVCQADNDHCAIIMPSGHIGKCEHYSEDHFIGHIDNEELDLEMITQFKERREEIEACTTCPTYPICNMLKLCATNTKCYSETRLEKLQKIRYGMLHAYQQHQTPQQDEI
jgi:radical SAM protein with 4Fe4S-binding SPASM domain